MLLIQQIKALEEGEEGIVDIYIYNNIYKQSMLYTRPKIHVVNTAN